MELNGPAERRKSCTLRSSQEAEQVGFDDCRTDISTLGTQIIAKTIVKTRGPLQCFDALNNGKTGSSWFSNPKLEPLDLTGRSICWFTFIYR